MSTMIAVSKPATAAIALIGLSITRSPLERRWRVGSSRSVCCEPAFPDCSYHDRCATTLPAGSGGATAHYASVTSITPCGHKRPITRWPPRAPLSPRASCPRPASPLVPPPPEGGRLRWPPSGGLELPVWEGLTTVLAPLGGCQSVGDKAP